MHSVHFTNTAGGVGIAHAFATHHAFVFVRWDDANAESQARVTALHQALTTHTPSSPNELSVYIEPYRDVLDIALVLHKDHILTLATTGSGIIFLKRNETLVELVAQGNIAQGPPMRGDAYVLTHGEYVDALGGLEGFTYYFTHYTGQEVVELMKTAEDQSIVGGFVVVQYGSLPQKHEPLIPPPHQDANTLAFPSDIASERSDITEAISPDSSRELTSQATSATPQEKRRIHKSLRTLLTAIRIPTVQFRLPRRRYLALIVCMVALVLGVLVWSGRLSIPYGNSQKASAIDDAEKKIDSLIQEAEESSLSDISQLGALFATMHMHIEAISDADRERHVEAVLKLEDMVQQKEKELMRIAETESIEFFDFGLLAKSVVVQDIDFVDATFYILDATEGVVYTVTTDRAQEKYASNKYKGATQITATGTSIYVLTKNEGIYLVGPDISTSVVAPDSAWRDVADMKAYTGNIYMLDAERRTITKYQGVDEKTFGPVSPYLVPEVQGTIQETEYMTIDGAIYTMGTASIRKYLTGRRVDFKLQTPYTKNTFTAIYTNPDIESLYVYDDTNHALYQLSKEGIFEKLWRVPYGGIAVATDHTGDIFVVTKEKIYSLAD